MNVTLGGDSRTDACVKTSGSLSVQIGRIDSAIVLAGDTLSLSLCSRGSIFFAVAVGVLWLKNEIRGYHFFAG